MPLFKKLATLATAAEAARRYARNNPDKAGKYLDQAAAFVDKQTKGKYSSQITGATQKAKGAAGIRPTPGHGPTGNGFTEGGLGQTASYPPAQPAATQPTPTQRPPYPGTPQS